MGDLQVVPVERLEMAFEPGRWDYADRNSAGIDAHFAKLKAANPSLWNGRVLLLRRYHLEAGVLRGGFFETDFASLIAWRDWGFPESGAVNCFAMTALQSADGGFLLGVMGPDTVNAGRIYFAAGTPDPEDIAGDTVDLESNVWRELGEETGLIQSDVVAEPGWQAVLAGPRLALMKVVRSPLSAVALRKRIVAWLAEQSRPELSDIRIARDLADLDPMMPEFIQSFLLHVWSASAR